LISLRRKLSERTWSLCMAPRLNTSTIALNVNLNYARHRKAGTPVLPAIISFSLVASVTCRSRE
jgi:hypothetical protein